jgi:acid phosphatase type 7
MYNRRSFFKKISLLSAGGMGLGMQSGVLKLSRSSGPLDENEFGFEALPVLANVQADQIEIIVSPNDLAAGWVEYGNDRNVGHRVDAVSYGMHHTSDRVLKFKLTGLQPGKEYFYRVTLQQIVYHNNHRHETNKQVKSEISQFTTLDPKASTASFSCWNDTHENNETLKRLADKLHNQQPDFLVWNGDVTNDIFREEQIVGQFLNPAEQAYASIVPMMFSRGNHDVRGRDARYLQDYLTGPGGMYYYGFRQGPLATLVMDTGEDKPDNHPSFANLLDFEGFRSEQAQWLESVIDETWFASAPFRVVFMHIPLVWETEVPERWPSIWGEGINGWICEDGHKKWHDLLVRAGVQLVISGHTHRPAYFPPSESRPYGQLIGGGPQPERATCITGIADENELNVTMSDLDGNALELITFEA